MKKILLASATVALLLGGSACSTDYDIYPAEMNKVLAIKDSGSRSTMVYSTQDIAPYPLTVIKGGVAPEMPVTATLRVMSAEEFNTYIESSGMPYEMMPESCYTLGEGASTSTPVAFAAGEGYKIVNVNLNADAIGNFYDNFTSKVNTPVIPIVLECADANVREEDSRVFLTPTYSVPTVGFTTQGGAHFNLDANGESSIEISLPIENQWNIGMTVEADPAALSAYNAANGTNYEMIPADAYEIPEVITMAEGESTVTGKIKINSSKVDLLKGALALRLKSVDVPGIEVDGVNNTLVLNTSVDLTEEMLSTNAQEPSEGAITNLLDGNINTFFHSAWSVSVTDNHYIQITLPNACSRVAIQYNNRNSGTSQSPAYFNLYVGTSNSNLELYKHFEWNDGDPEKNYGENIRGGAAEMNILTPAAFASPKSVFRIENEQSWNGNKFFCMSTLTVYAL